MEEDILGQSCQIDLLHPETIQRCEHAPKSKLSDSLFDWISDEIRSVCRFGQFTAKWRYWSINRLNEDTLPAKLKRGSRELQFKRSGKREEDEMYLITTLCIKQDPAKLNYFGRVLCNIYAMFITRCGHMDDHITVEIRFLPLIVCHPNILTWGFPEFVHRPEVQFAALLAIRKVGRVVVARGREAKPDADYVLHCQAKGRRSKSGWTSI